MEKELEKDPNLTYNQIVNVNNIFEANNPKPISNKEALASISKKDEHKNLDTRERVRKHTEKARFKKEQIIIETAAGRGDALRGAGIITSDHDGAANAIANAILAKTITIQTKQAEVNVLNREAKAAKARAIVHRGAGRFADADLEDIAAKDKQEKAIKASEIAAKEKAEIAILKKGLSHYAENSEKLSEIEESLKIK